MVLMVIDNEATKQTLETFPFLHLGSRAGQPDLAGGDVA